MSNYSKITGVILSGGKSSRMGINKSLLEIDGVPLIKIIYDLLDKIFDEIIISTNEPDIYEFINAKKVEDHFKGLGPLTGIYSSLNSAASEKIFVISTDMPFITKSLIDFLVAIDTKQPIVLPKAEGRIQYLCGIYDKEILPIAGHVLASADEAKKIYDGKKNFNLSIKSFVDRVGAEIIDVEFEKFHFNDLFFNINTPEDFEYVKSRIIF